MSGEVSRYETETRGRRWWFLNRLGAISISHLAVDVYSALLPPLMLVFEQRLDLGAGQIAFILGLGSLTSGISQPLCAWVSDRLDSRLPAPAGLLLAAVCLSSLGLASNYLELILVYGAGMFGVGAFHPVAAASAGELSERGARPRRTLGVTIFFLAGMMGGVLGAKLGPWISQTNGEADPRRLLYLLLPGVLLALMLLPAIRHLPHRPHEHHEIRFDRREIRARWLMVLLLYAGNTCRFTVNVALYYLYNRWAERMVTADMPGADPERIAASAAPIVGTLMAFSVIGMAIGGVTAGSLTPQGRERWPIVMVPIAAAPVLLFFGGTSLATACMLALLVAIGFAAAIPVSLSFAQRLLPHRASLASGLMLGGAWAIAFVGPLLAEFCLSEGGLDLSLETTFALTGALLALSGILGVPLRSSTTDQDRAAS